MPNKDRLGPIFTKILSYKDAIINVFNDIESLEKDFEKGKYTPLAVTTSELDCLYYQFGMGLVPLPKELNNLAKAYNTDITRFKKIASKYVNQPIYTYFEDTYTNIRVLYAQARIIHCMLITDKVYQDKFRLAPVLDILMLNLEDFISKEEINYFQACTYYLASANYTQKIVLKQVIDAYLCNPAAINRITKEILK